MKFTIITAFFLFILLSACNNESLCIKGDGQIVEFDLSLDDFTKISLSGPIDLKIIQSDTPSLKIQAERQLMDVLAYQVRNNELEIGFERNIRCLNSSKGVLVVATISDLSQIRTDGSSDIFSEGNINLDELIINSHGEANVELSGFVANQVLVGDGKLDVRNFNLLTNLTEIEISGLGHFDINCSSELTIDVNGAATVNYKGTPSISQKVNGSLDLNNAND